MYESILLKYTYPGKTNIFFFTILASIYFHGRSTKGNYYMDFKISFIQCRVKTVVNVQVKIFI